MGLIYLDACLLIYLVERHPQRGQPIADALARNDQMRFGISLLVKTESLVAPMRRGDWMLRDSYIDLFSRFVPLDMPETVYLKAAELWGRFGLKTPDALHLVCAQHYRRKTNDDRLTQASFGLACRILAG